MEESSYKPPPRTSSFSVSFLLPTAYLGDQGDRNGIVMIETSEDDAKNNVNELGE